jgi:hypothetical protein
MMKLLLLAFLLPALSSAFLVRQPTNVHSSSALAAAGDRFDLTIDLPPSGSKEIASLRFDSMLSVPSEAVVVRYKVPFGLDVVPKKGLAVCTKDGAGGERVGDVLRYTSQWSLGLPRGESLGNTAASFAGGLFWQCSMYDLMKAKAWEQVVNALTSNTDTHTDEVVLVFERPVGGTAPEFQ